MTKIALYIRVSTEEQATQGVSLEAQEESLINYCKTYNYEIYKIYKEAGKSAKNLKGRPEMQKLLKDAKNKKFDAILIYKLDRFSRSLKDLILTIEMLKNWGVDFISLQDKIETNSASGKLMFHIISSFAEFERDIIGERTKFGMEKKAKDGAIQNRAPLGYIIKDKKMYPDPETKELIPEIFNFFITYKSLSKTAKNFGYSTRGIKKLLMNKTYLGMIKFGNIWRFGKHEAILNPNLFEKVQRIIENLKIPAQLKKSKTTNQNPFVSKQDVFTND